MVLKIDSESLLSSRLSSSSSRLKRCRFALGCRDCGCLHELLPDETVLLPKADEEFETSDA